jgi:uncharacterized protein
MKNKLDWDVVGAVVGNTTTSNFTFAPKTLQVKLGDIVCTQLAVPGSSKDKLTALVWGRIISLGRVNPFFPAEAAQELANAGVSLLDTVLSSSRDQLDAKVLILGATYDQNYVLSPLIYPVEPGGIVYSPPSDIVEKFLTPTDKQKRTIEVGNLIGRTDVSVSLAADKIVARHMAILAMTGGGKTVASRRVIRELCNHKYPLIIFDPHGDYLGLYTKQKELGVKVRIFTPKILLNRDDLDTVFSLVSKWGFKLTDPQIELLNYLLHNGKYKRNLHDWLNELRSYADNLARRKRGKETTNPDEDSFKSASINAVNRSLRRICEDLSQMEIQNTFLKERLQGYEFEDLPDLSTHAHEICQSGQVSIVYLGGYNHITQSVIVSLIMESLFAIRAQLNNKIPPFYAVVEEAHNFIPSRSEGTDDTPSLSTLRKVITEGRKFGTGLLLISQRPSRLDETILSQCNTYLVLRLVNPRDQSFVQRVMENLSDEDSKILASFGPGQGLISGQAVKFPLLVKIKFDEDLQTSEIGTENFLDEAAEWILSSEQINASKALKASTEIKPGARETPKYYRNRS